MLRGRDHQPGIGRGEVGEIAGRADRGVQLDPLQEYRVFVNAVDDLENASAYMGAVLRRAGVTIALSTDGEAPALAGLMREALEALLPDDLDAWMDTARDARRQWLTDGVSMERRRPLLLEALEHLYEKRRTAAP